MRESRRRRWVGPLGIAAVLTCLATSALGAGFALIEQGVSGLGNAFAGGSAVAEDPSTVFFNPAGMTRLPGHQALAAVHVIAPQAEFNNKGSTHVLQPLTGIPLLGGDGGDAGQLGVVPNLFYTVRPTDGLAFGLGVSVPFGLETEYSRSWVGRYHAVKSELVTVNINPSVAFKITEFLNFGFGIDVMYLDAELTNRIDFGTFDQVLLGGALGLTPQGDDGFVKLNGDSWDVGFNAGMLIEFTENTRLGLAYRSKVNHKVEGDAKFSDVPTGVAVATGGWFTDTDVEARVDLPATASVSIYHRFNPFVAVMGDVTWTQWSLFRELRFKFDNGQPDGVTTENWNDTWRYSIGLTVNPTERWALRTGVAFDETPIPDAKRRTPRIPGEDRLWIAFGLGYRALDWFSFDFGYAHLFVDDAEINKDPVGEDALRGGLKGKYDASVDIFSAQVTFRF